MSSPSTHPIVRAYLAELRTAARTLPRRRREELVREIQAHLAEALPPDATEAEIRAALDRLGEPTEIVEAEGGRPPTAPPRGGALEWIAIALLLIGGVVVPVLGWVVGVVLLWASRVWTLRDKLLGTLVVPGGLGGVLVLLASQTLTPTRAEVCVSGPQPAGANPTTALVHCTDGTSIGDIGGIALLVALVIAPIVTAAYLARRAQSPVAHA